MNLPTWSQFNDALKSLHKRIFQKMHTTKCSRFSVSSPSQAEVDCDVFEEERNRVDPLKWAAQLPIGHTLPSPPKHRIFPVFFVATKRAAFPSHSRFVHRRGTQRLIVVWLIFSTGIDDQIQPAHHNFAKVYNLPTGQVLSRICTP